MPLAATARHKAQDIPGRGDANDQRAAANATASDMKRRSLARPCLGRCDFDYQRLIVAGHSHGNDGVCALGEIERAGEVVRAPEVMRSKEAFDRWLVEFAEKSSPATTWLSTAVKRELNFVQDYFVAILVNLSGSASDSPTVGAIIRQDFIDLSSKLENAAFEFFTKDARSRRLSDLNEWHKYSPQATESRLQDTVLLSKWAEIKASLPYRD